MMQPPMRGPPVPQNTIMHRLLLANQGNYWLLILLCTELTDCCCFARPQGSTTTEGVRGDNPEHTSSHRHHADDNTVG